MTQMEFKIIDVDDLAPNPFQPRESFKKDDLIGLADSLKSRGELQPIIVRKYKKGYQIICGERRWRAAKLAGLKKIPVIVRDTAEEDVLLESLIENLHRLDLTSTERENAIYELWKSRRWKTYEELGKALGISYHTVLSNIEAASIRKKERISAEISTRTIMDTVGLEKEERRQIIEKVKREELPVEKVQEVTRVVKEAPKEIKKAVLKPKTRITPRIAESLIKLPEEKQRLAIKHIEGLRLEEDEAIAHIEALKVELPFPPPEKIAEVRERYEKLGREIRAKLETSEAIEKGKQFRNWTGHIAIIGTLGSVSCPICGSKELGWLCHKLNIKEALKESERRYKESIKVVKK